MAQLEEKPEPFRRGQRQLSAGDLNQMIEIIPRQIQGGRSTRASYYGDRVVLTSHQPGSSLPAVENYLTQMVVLQEFDDYLLCTPYTPPLNEPRTAYMEQIYNADLGTDSILLAYVAKPYDLRKTPWDGQTVNLNGIIVAYTYIGTGKRLVSGESGQIEEDVTPSYFPGDLIVVSKANTGLVDSNYHPIIYLDINSGGRSWVGSGSGNVTNVCPIFIDDGYPDPALLPGGGVLYAGAGGVVVSTGTPADGQILLGSGGVPAFRTAHGDATIAADGTITTNGSSGDVGG